MWFLDELEEWAAAEMARAAVSRPGAKNLARVCSAVEMPSRGKEQGGVTRSNAATGSTEAMGQVTP